MKNRKGITLIALVITIILLIILSGVTLNLVMGENGLIKRAKHSGQEHDIARVKEKLELEKTEVALDNYNVATLNEYINQIIKKGIITSDDILNEWNISNGSCYIQTENDYKFKIEEDKENKGNIKISYVDKIAASELDNNSPQEANVVIAGNTTQESLPVSLTATVTHNDLESGIDISKCKYVLNNNSDFIGTEESAYTGGNFETNNEEIEINLSNIDDWYLHVLSVDNVNKSKETVVGPINVTANYHEHTGNSSTNGGCYNRPYYYYRYTSPTYCTHPNLGYAGVGGRDFYRCYECSTTNWDCPPGPVQTGSTTSYAYGYSVPSGATTVSVTYQIGCNKTTSTIENYSITY